MSFDEDERPATKVEIDTDVDVVIKTPEEPIAVKVESTVTAADIYRIAYRHALNKSGSSSTALRFADSAAREFDRENDAAGKNAYAWHAKRILAEGVTPTAYYTRALREVPEPIDPELALRHWD